MIDKLQILKELKHHLQQYSAKPVGDVILFGSRALGGEKEFSDFDVLIILEKDYSRKDEDIILDLCYDIDLKFNILIDAHIISRSELNSLRGKQPLYINAINRGIYA